MKEFRLNERSIINRDDECLAAYLRDVTKYETISPEKEAELARQVKAGGKKGERAKEQLVTANLRFVVSVANQYKQGKVELVDLISEGNIGLIKAAETFDESRGFKFISYAVWWIRQSIMAALDRTGTMMRIPSNQQRILRRFRMMDADMMQREMRHVTVEEFCEVSGLGYDKVSSILAANSKIVELDKPLDDDADCTFGDMVSTNDRHDSAMDKESLHMDLMDAITKCLKERDAAIVCEYFGIGAEPMTLAHVAERHGLSIERTRQICLNAMAKLRQSPFSTNLAAYLAA